MKERGTVYLREGSTGSDVVVEVTGLGRVPRGLKEYQVVVFLIPRGS